MYCPVFSVPVFSNESASLEASGGQKMPVPPMAKGNSPQWWSSVRNRHTSAAPRDFAGSESVAGRTQWLFRREQLQSVLVELATQPTNRHPLQSEQFVKRGEDLGPSLYNGTQQSTRREST